MIVFIRSMEGNLMTSSCKFEQLTSNSPDGLIRRGTLVQVPSSKHFYKVKQIEVTKQFVNLKCFKK